MYKYVHGGDIYALADVSKDEIMDYSANINPLGLPIAVREAVKECIKDCVNYPDPFCRKLVEKLAGHLQVDSSYIFLSNGAADVLFKLALALQPKHTLLLAPTFADYEKAVASVGSKVEYYNLQEADRYIVQNDILKAITKRIDMVILCNPNNPTGQLVNKKLLLKIAAKCQNMNIPLLVDECFLDFVEGGQGYSLLGELETYSNLIVLKAFTKTYAMPGLRLGYCVTSKPELLERLRECGQDWNVSTPAQVAGYVALDEQAYVNESMELIKEEREYLKAQLEFLGFTVLGGEANYLFLKSNRSIDWVTALRKQNILIRDCSNYHNLGRGYYRVAIKKRPCNRKLIRIMKDIIKHALITGSC